MDRFAAARKQAVTANEGFGQEFGCQLSGRARNAFLAPEFSFASSLRSTISLLSLPILIENPELSQRYVTNPLTSQIIKPGRMRTRLLKLSSFKSAFSGSLVPENDFNIYKFSALLSRSYTTKFDIFLQKNVRLHWPISVPT